ncbi:MAG: UDP-3-O-(3-hydroxymyristoyl)glucosamine N-acyltransferase [Gammaproteobacteria bacterium]|nr:UDP-3-O-(3-hydroxymyristoyl)glucosamine N-acyltransferase [Gammaproteobacteria bacterium]NIV49674.1 UDP-3-O-(3-hydroxymyristoyl)glucosamine N-acyltransferase [Gammaproteobacteria bacterium]NIW57072.1 UDP-3-O-(3-hydroxymyristoyl)glucosamine N-acyltransferase [Gammaproteobacteria bacterium]
MTAKVSDIIEQFPKLLRLRQGDAATEFSRPRSPSTAEPGCILFINDRRLIEDAVRAPASVLVVNDGDCDHEALEGAPQTLLQSPNPELALALVAQAFFPVTASREGFDGSRIHASAVISESADISDDAIIGPNAVIGSNVRIGRGCIIGANTTVEADAEIGEGSHIHANVFIAHGTIIGKHCEIHPMTSVGTEGYGYAHDEQFNHYRHVHYGRLIIEDDVHLGACVSVDRGRFLDSVIGRGTKIDNHCHLGHNTRIGKNCLLTGGCMTAGTATIGDNNVFGGRSSISDHVTVGDNMQFSAASAVFKDINQPGKAFGGHPLQPVNEHLKSYASIAQLPRIRKDITRIMRKLGMS